MKNNKRNKKKKNKSENIWRTLGGNLIIWLLVIIMAVTALQFFSTDYKNQIIDYTQFQEYVDESLIESGVISGRTFQGTLKERIIIESTSINQSKEFIKFNTVLPEVTDEMMSFVIHSVRPGRCPSPT